MSLKQVLPSVLMTGALLVASAPSHALVITIDPKGSPLTCGVADFGAQIDCSSFQTDTVQGTLGSQLTISNYQDPGAGGSLFASYSEIGSISITSFSLNSQVEKFTASFKVWATFELSGLGVWSVDDTGDTIFTAGTAALSNSAIYGSWGANPAVKLADLTLLSGNLAATANATDKSTNLSASFGIDPVAGSLGVGGFFVAPAIWNVDLFANNVGFGTGTGTVTPDPLVDGDPVYFTTNLWAPGAIGGSGSFNGAFVTNVPEPGSLALSALAILGLGVFTRRKSLNA